MLAIQDHQFDKRLAKTPPKPYTPHPDNTISWQVEKVLRGKWIWWFWEGDTGAAEVLGKVLTAAWMKGQS